MAKGKLVSEMGKKELEDLIKRAVDLTYQKEGYLFEHGLSEWTVAFQFAYYLRVLCQDKLGEYSVDAEYTRAKLTDELCLKYTGDGHWCRPDLIIHKRDSSSLEDASANVLWIEIKRRGGKRLENDFRKLKVVTREANREIEAVAGYRFGLSLLMPNDEAGVEYRWFENGNESTRNCGVSVDLNGVGRCVR